MEFRFFWNNKVKTGFLYRTSIELSYKTVRYKKIAEVDGLWNFHIANLSSIRSNEIIKDNNQDDWLTLIDYYKAGNMSKNIIPMLHTSGFTHFDLLASPHIPQEAEFAQAIPILKT